MSARRMHAAPSLAALGALAALVVVASICTSHPAAAQPVVSSVVSRMTHGQTAGQGGQIFDLPLPQIAPYGVECRQTTTGLSIVVTFDRPIASGSAAIVGPGAAVAGANGVVIAGNSMTVNLTNVVNASQINLRLTNVVDTNGQSLATKDLFFRVLWGDCNGSGSMSVADVNYLKQYNPTNTGALHYGNYRADLNLSGTISTGDVNIVKAQMSTSLPLANRGAHPNTAPIISNITDQSTPAGTPTSTVNFTVGDAESPPENLYVYATSSNQTVVPNANIVLGGTGANRTIAITPAADQVGTATITVTVTDGIAITTDTFLLTAGNAQKLYVATLRPTDSNTATSGSGVATLLVSGDQSQAVLRVSYSNLSTNKTASHVHLGDSTVTNGAIIFDVDQPPANSLQPDGSYVWVITPAAGGVTIQQIQDSIAAGATYFNVHTTKYPNGELRGQFQFASGSQTFTPPPDAPALSAADSDLTSEPQATKNAVRFLQQASFGATNGTGTAPADIAHLKALGTYNAWLDEQFNTPTTSMLGVLTRRIKVASPTYTLDSSNIREIWWNTVLGGTDYTNGGARLGDDQLRQRVALALSEIFVISQVEETISSEPLGVASYHDTLANGAFGNFRTLMKDVTLHPIMGQYLNMKGNKKKATATSPDPNENYAREIMQLFTVGLNRMHPDGTLQLDAAGLPIPVYDQSTIQNFARIFTGWDYQSTPQYYDYYDPTTMQVLTGNATNYLASSRYVKPMVANQSNHDTNSKVVLRNVTIPAGIPNADDELDLALDNIFLDPNVGPFISRRLIQRLVTSVPSPAYVWRVARVFDGYRSSSETSPSAPKGDLKETVRAILTDYEARSSTQIGNQGFGKIKEPILRVAQTIRAFHPFSTTGATGKWTLPNTETDFGQQVYKASTVFNFFEPDYTIVQNLTKQDGTPYTLPLNAPEMQITTENTTIYLIKMMKRGVLDNAGFSNDNGSASDVRLNFATEQLLAGTTAAVPGLVDSMNSLLMAGQMPSASGSMRDQIITYVQNAPTIGNADERVRVAAYLIAASPQFGVQK